MLKDSKTITQSSSLIKHNSKNNSIHNELSYNELVNMRTTLLHMQYLYSQLEASLSKQYQNQQNQHKDHIIQCYNMRQQLEQLKKNNFMKLFIVKLEELLSIEEDNNKRLIQQQAVIDKYNQNHQQQYEHTPKQQQEQYNKEYTITPMIDKLLTFVQIKQQQMQHSLCKLYLGNKVMLDLDKTSKSIDSIERKIDDFMGKNVGTIEMYNKRLEELQETKQSCQEYMSSVDSEVINIITGEQQQASTMSDNTRRTKYEQHIRNKLNQQQQLIQLRINSLKKKLLQFD